MTVDCSKDKGGGGGRRGRGIQRGLPQEISNAMNGQLHFSTTFPGVHFGFFTTFPSVYTSCIISINANLRPPCTDIVFHNGLFIVF